MKIFFDFLPVVLFFIAYKISGIYAATLVAMIATVGQILWSWHRTKTVDTALWVSLILIVVFGGATLAFHDETFIKWKPTVLYWLLSITLFVSVILFDKNWIRAAMSKHISLSDNSWSVLNTAWGVFFILMGFANLYVASYYSTDIWVNFKLFGSTALMAIFLIIQVIWLSGRSQSSDK